MGGKTGRAAKAGAKDWWGVKLLGQPTQFIFGYGSLINSASRHSSAGKTIPAIPVRISAAFGYIRTWNDRSASGFTALGLRKSGPDEKASTINGVLYAVDADDIAKYDVRETGYARVEVPRDDIEAVSWQRLPLTGKIWVYIPVEPNGEPGVGLPAASAQFPLLESYIDLVVEGGLEYGEDFARELIETTSDWSDYWLNDRELARRPWMRDPDSAKVDRLLMSAPHAAAKLNFRLFSEPYAIHWAAKKARRSARNESAALLQEGDPAPRPAAQSQPLGRQPVHRPPGRVVHRRAARPTDDGRPARHGPILD